METSQRSAITALAVVTVLLAAFLVGRHEWLGSRGPTLERKYAGTMTLNPEPVEPGGQLRVGFRTARPDDRSLIFERWDGGGYGPRYLLGQGHFHRLAPPHETYATLTMVPLRPLAAFETDLPRSTPPGRYRVCDLERDACALLTVAG